MRFKILTYLLLCGIIAGCASCNPWELIHFMGGSGCQGGIEVEEMLLNHPITTTGRITTEYGKARCEFWVGVDDVCTKSRVNVDVNFIVSTEFPTYTDLTISDMEYDSYIAYYRKNELFDDDIKTIDININSPTAGVGNSNQDIEIERYDSSVKDPKGQMAVYLIFYLPDDPDTMVLGYMNSLYTDILQSVKITVTYTEY